MLQHEESFGATVECLHAASDHRPLRSAPQPRYNLFLIICKYVSKFLQWLMHRNEYGLKYADFDYLEVRGAAVFPATALPALRNLHMNDCDLCEISDSITRLKNLSWFQVSENPNIHTIPEDLALLDKLQTFSFEGCQIADEVLKLRSDKGSAKNIQRYLSAKREGKSAWRRMKLMFMGESNAGKTSLVRALARSGQGICSNKYAGVMRYAIRQHHDMEKLEQERKGMPELSTVGVDLNDWFYPKDNSDPKMPPIWFDTWDFAGQEVYQITHQYFISRRCLYLLVFNTVECTNEGYKVRDKASLRQELKKWLNNIYCRIPNAHFILVGTRMDIAKDKHTKEYQPQYFEMMEEYLKGEFKQPIDESRKQTSGFPIVKDVIFVACTESKDQNNIVYLCKQIWKRASEIKSDATGADKNQNLIDIEVPKKYKEVEGWIKELREDLKERNQEPILSGAKLREEINRHLLNRKVRAIDTAEFGTMMNFMHENGIILHYESTLLNDKYFVDPQWMADQLAEVITVKENQNYGTNLDPGIARINDFLLWISKIAAVSKFKTWPCLFIPLLSQFEVALKFSDNYMLIPSSLPTEREYSERRHNQRTNDIPTSSVMVPEQSGLQAMSTFQPNQKRMRRGIYRKHYKSFSKYEILKGAPPHAGDLVDTDRSILQVWFPEADDVRSLSKFMVFSYIPFGFWARLIARIISDEQFSLTAGDILQPEFKTDQESQFSPVLDYALNSGFTWRCWKTGVALFLWDHIPILEIKEVLSEQQCRKSSPFSQLPETVKIRKHELVNAQGHMARTLNTDSVNSLNSVEFRDEKLKKSFPKQVLSIKVFTNTALIIESRKYHNYALTYDTYFGPNIQNLAHLFEQISQHVDMLLAEWYPNLGERPQMGFDSEYDHSIERIIPCPKCLAAHDKTALPVCRLHLQFSLDNIRRHCDRKKAQAILKQQAEEKKSSQKSRNRANSGSTSSSEDEHNQPKKKLPFKSMDPDATPTVESKRISFTRQKSVDFGDLDDNRNNFNRQRSGTARQSPDGESTSIEHFMRRYTTAIGSDESFDYSRDWREFHGMEPNHTESQSRLAIPRGDFTDGSQSTIGSYGSSPRASIAPSFRHTMSMRERGRSLQFPSPED